MGCPDADAERFDELILDMLCAMRPSVKRDAFDLWLRKGDQRMPYLHIDQSELRRAIQWMLARPVPLEPPR